MSRKLLSLGVALACLLMVAAMAWADQDALKYQPSKDLKALVDKAASMVSEKGEAAFADFNKKGSEWFQGELYVFVFTMDGVLVCDPASPADGGQKSNAPQRRLGQGDR
jgi:cytochrome c